MTDPISVASFALALLKTGGEQLNKLRERAQATKDLEVKEHVGNLYDTMNSLKEAFSRLSDENSDLKRQLEAHAHAPEKPTLRQVGEMHYYFLSNNDGPYCQTCYVNKNKLVKLPTPEPWNGGLRRDCPVCDGTFWDRRMSI